MSTEHPLEHDAASSELVPPDDLSSPRSTAHSPSLVVPSTITRLATVTRFNSSESTQANSLFLAPHAKIFPRTAIPHVLFYRDYHPTPIFIIGFVGQSMLDQLISIGELRQQVVLDPIAEGFQVI